MIRVTIEEFDNRGRVMRSVMRSSLEADADQDDFQPSIGEVIAYAIWDFKPPRADLVVAEIINVTEFVRYDYFDGRNDAIIALENAAHTISEGWFQYDERTKQQC